MKPEAACTDMHERISARLDGELPPDEVALVEDHLGTCSDCRRYDEALRAVRRAVRTRPAEEVPDLTARIMDRMTGEVPRLHRRKEWSERIRVASLAAAASALVFFGATLPVGEGIGDVASASEIVRSVRAAARTPRSYTAEFHISERGWHPAVPVRRFDASVEFKGPERFSLTIEDVTDYPDGSWPRNDVELRSDGRRWSIQELSACPVEALPGCSAGGPERRTILDRQPFDGTSALPTDLIVPLETIGASVGLVVLEARTTAGRRSLRVQLPFQQAEPLVSSLQSGGSWRKFHPQDPVTIDLDARTWFPLAFQVRAGDSAERAAWAQRFGYLDRPGASLFRATATAFSEGVSGRFDVPASGIVKNGGFQDDAPTSGPIPSDLAGLQPYRSGLSGGVSIRTYVRGLTWLKIVHDPSGRRTTQLLSSEELRIPGVGVGYFDPASLHSARRIDLFPRGEHVAIESNLPRRRMIEVAASMPVKAVPLPRVIDLPGGLVVERLDPRDVDPPRSVPDGYRVVGVVRSTSQTGRMTTTMYLRRPEAEYDGFGIRIVTSEGAARLTPPGDRYVEVSVAGTAGRWSPERAELEWIDGRTYRAVSAPSFDLSAVLEIANGLQ